MSTDTAVPKSTIDIKPQRLPSPALFAGPSASRAKHADQRARQASLHQQSEPHPRVAAINAPFTSSPLTVGHNQSPIEAATTDPASDDSERRHPLLISRARPQNDYRRPRQTTDTILAESVAEAAPATTKQSALARLHSPTVKAADEAQFADLKRTLADVERHNQAAFSSSFFGSPDALFHASPKAESTSSPDKNVDKSPTGKTPIPPPGRAVFGARHAAALEDLRRSQLALAKAWRTTTEPPPDPDPPVDDTQSAGTEASATNEFDEPDDETRQDGPDGESAQTSSARRQANDAYFASVKTRVDHVVSNLRNVTEVLKRVEMESRDMWTSVSEGDDEAEDERETSDRAATPNKAESTVSESLLDSSSSSASASVASGATTRRGQG